MGDELDDNRKLMLFIGNSRGAQIKCSLHMYIVRNILILRLGRR